MSSATSVLRRYTPPTCTLEIAAKESPLSRWMGQTVLKNLRFKLSFDDPRVSEDQWMTIRGDRTELQALCDAVTSYVQKFLTQSSNSSSSSTVIQGGTTAIGGALSSPTLPSNFQPQFESGGNPAGIYLEPKGMLSHELHLGSLANEKTGSAIRLSAVQLADLATALDEYSADVTAIPTLNRPSWVSTTPAWGKIAAASLVAIGLTTSAVRLLDRQPQTQIAEAPQGSDQRLAVQPLPTAPTAPASPLLPSLPTTTVPLPSIATTNPPAPSSTTTTTTAPTTPADLPKFKVEQKAPENAGSTQIQVREAPAGTIAVAPLPNNAKTAKSGAPANARSAQGDPEPPADLSSASAAASADRAPAAATTQNRPMLPSLANAQQRASEESATPQNDQVKAYFQQRWNPPQGLSDAIQYVLTIAPDGSLAGVEAFGQNAELFRDRASIPPIGTIIASPNSKGQTTKIQILLKTDKTVQTFVK